VIHWDLRGGVPFPGESFDAVYHSHLLEHLEYEEVEISPTLLQWTRWPIG
jgi:predicted SAM-dependent methyltransferase